MKLRLIKATAKDANLIKKISQKGNIWVYPRSWIKALVKNKAVVMFKQSTRTVGYLSYILSPMLKTVYILQIAVDPKYQGHNIGTQVIERFKKIWKRKGMKYIYLHSIKQKVVKWLVGLDFKIAVDLLYLWFLMTTL